MCELHVNAVTVTYPQQYLLVRIVVVTLGAFGISEAGKAFGK